MNRTAIMYTLFSLALAVPLAAAHAQSASGNRDAGTDRVDRRCTSSALSTDAAAPCPDDAIYDGRGPVSQVVRPPPVNPSTNTGGGDNGASASSAGQGGTGTVGSSGGTNAAGAASSGAPMGVSPRAAGSP